MFQFGDCFLGKILKRFCGRCCKSSNSCCPLCRKCLFCWRGLFYREEFLLEDFYEEISPQEWGKLEKEARKIRGKAEEKIVLVETNILSPFLRCNSSEGEPISQRRSLVDYQASDFITEQPTNKSLSSKERLNTGKIRSYTEPDFAEDMWKAKAETKTKNRSLRGLFRKKKYSKFVNEQDEESPTMSEPFYNVESRINLKTKILTRRSQRMNTETDVDNFPSYTSPPSIFDDNEIEASISFAAHVRRQGPGFTAKCTQTLRRCDFSLTDVFESEVQSNVTFNPLFHDDDSEDDDNRMHPRRYRLYTIEEESEAFDSDTFI